jgi:3-hydroxyacyl-CoA dehydrogenase/enoyl-CoA hydratase/3-hydroxybutyryl-CoA epimerase
MTFKNFEIEYDKNILIAYWNMPDRSMNVIDKSVMDELDKLIYHVVEDETVKGCVIASKKKDFSGGADLSLLEESKRQYDKAVAEQGEEAANIWFFDDSSRLSRIYRRIETCGKPFVAAIHGICLGGSFELALACHYRIMVADKRTKVGLPEVKVGLFPGAGGTTRVSRLMETDQALQFLLKGNPVDATKALKMNLVHEICTDIDPVVRAKQWIENSGDPIAPWDKKDFKNPSGKVFSPKGMMVWPAANALYRKETYNNYPGARAILTGVYEGLQVPFNLALKIESRLFANILRSKEAEAMIKTLFLSKNELDKGARRPANFPETNIKKIGVIGAGLMGAGIAYVSAQNGLDVVLLDTTLEKVQAGKETINKLVSKQVFRGKMTAEEKDTLLNRIEESMHYNSLRDVDLVIEAVFEDRAVKEEVLKKVQEVVGLDTIVASNTSTLPITSLAENVTDPGKFIGIHFFSPVDKMMLVEVIKGKETDELALATALDFVRIIKKTPIVVNDSRGFYANRCVLNYVLEGHLMLAEGVPPAMIENVAKMAGMPVGPLALNDEVGLDLGWKILQATKKDLGPDAVNPVQENLLHYMVEEHGRYGRKNGKGFYDYHEDGKKTLWSGLNNRYGILVSDLVDVEELKNRFLFTQSLEALRTMKEGIVTDQREADVGSIFGFGFPPFTGGTISFVDYVGKDKFIQVANDLEKKFGPRFEAPKSLREH